MKHICTFLILAVTAVNMWSASAPVDNRKAMGDSAYAKQAYDMALMHYRTALETEGPSSDLYYNLGNTYYRLQDPGHAVINYERALRYNPANKEARINLNFVRKNLPDKIQDNTSFLDSLQNKITSLAKPDTWAWLALACFILVLGAGALYLFTANVALRKTGFFGGIGLCIAFIYLLFVSHEAASAIDDHSKAVVVAPITYMRSEPTTAKDKTEKVLPVHAGTVVEVVDSVATPDDPMTKKWYEVTINGAARAWVAQADVEKI